MSKQQQEQSTQVVIVGLINLLIGLFCHCIGLFWHQQQQVVVQRQETPVMRPKEVVAPAPRVETREVIKEVIKEVWDSQKSAYCGIFSYVY